MRKLFCSLAALLLVVTVGVHSGEAVNDVTFVPPKDVDVELTTPPFDMVIMGHDFVSEVDGGGLNLQFDPSVVHVLGVVIDPVWSFFTSPGVIDNTAGTVTGITFNAFNFPSNPSGDFNIATVTFAPMGLGFSELQLTDYALNPFAGGGSLLAHNLINGSINVVPEPASLSLLFLGLGGVGFLKKKKS